MNPLAPSRPFDRPTRRAVLRLCSGSIALPLFFRQALAAPSPLPRLVIFMSANGTNQSGFWPDKAGASPILSPLLGDERLRGETTLLKGMGLKFGRSLGNEHDTGFSTLWTGMPQVGTTESAWAGGPSIDQVIRKTVPLDVPFPSLNCGVLASPETPRLAHRVSFSYAAAARPLPTQTNVVKLYANWFRSEPIADAELAQIQARRRLAQRRTVLDLVKRDLAALQTRLGTTERQKLEQHAQALREFENRLSMALRPAATPSCPERPRAPLGDLDPLNGNNVPALMDAMLEFVALALACNLTRIVTFQIGLSAHTWRYEWLGINRDAHNEVAHLDTGKNELAAQQMRTIGHWHAQKVATLAARLAGMNEQDGRTLLDTSLLIWGNENASGYHSLERDLPIVLIGRAAGRLKTVGGVIDKGLQFQQNLCTSLLRIFGIEARGFGFDPTSGPFEGLELTKV